MSDKRKIGFDVLENTDIEKISGNGADFPAISKDTRNRILEKTREKYENAKSAPASAEPAAENDGYTVSGPAEIYHRPVIKRIATAAAGFAAAAVLISGSAFLMHKKPVGPPVTPDSDIVSNAVTEGTDPVTSTTDVTTTTSAETFMPEMTTVTAYIAKDFNITEPVSQEDIDTAREKVLEHLVHSDFYAFNLQYKYIDMNHDNIPELLVYYQNAYYAILIYRYNGTEYVCDINEYGYEDSIGFTSAPMINSDESCIYVINKEGATGNYYIKMNSDYSLDINSLVSSVSYYYNHEVISEEKYNELRNMYNSYDFSEIRDFIYVVGETDGVEAYMRQRYVSDDDPHGRDYAEVEIDKRYLFENGFFDHDTVYGIQHFDTYCDGTENFMFINIGKYSSLRYTGDKVIISVPYGENDDAPCHSRFRSYKENEPFVELFSLDIDFKNRTWKASSEDVYNYVDLWFDCPSDNNR
ncbi:MAG: hypothetical protein IKH78_02275 [Ruminococcus sp.]|nr:hypothetical protein [Ruminococcus sp.]